MLLSVIIPTCERNDLLAKCLDCLKPDSQESATCVQSGRHVLAGDPSGPFAPASHDHNSSPIAPSPPSLTYEVIVTDDGSTTTAEIMIRARYPWVRWICGPRKGPAANRNSGAKQADGDWLVFVDDDCLPDGDMLAGYHDAIEHNPYSNVIEGRTYSDRPRRTLAETCPVNERGGTLWSCNFAIRKSLFTSMCGFDERFPYACMEDVDFRDRLAGQGESFVFAATAAVCHPWRPRHIHKELRQHEQSMSIYLSIHPAKRSTFDARYYAMMAIRSAVKGTLPAVLKLRGAGFSCAIYEHLGYLRLALKRLSMR